MKKSEILAQTPARLERLKQHRWSFALIGSVALLGMAAAIAVAPATVNSSAPVSTVVEQLSLQAKPLSVLENHTFVREERIQRGDTMSHLLARMGVQDGAADTFIRTAPETKALNRQLAPGKVVIANTTEAGELRHLIFPLNSQDSAIVVSRQGEGFTAKQEALRFEKQILSKSIEIESSLFAATDGADIPDAIATQLAEIFAADLDFHRDLRKGDRFSVVYEMNYLRGVAARSGRVLSAEYTSGTRTQRAIWFEQNGRGGYYTAEGKSLRKAFLRSPLEFSRVTSGFSLRFHPILKEWRAHKGVDYGAPTGTRVRATGDGIVEFAGRQGGYGNMVILRHNGNYTTAYAHLNGFAPGIRKGARVTQGDTVGTVGATGWATGPHLHYEFRIGGQQVNPLAISLPTALPLDQAQMQLFRSIANAQLSKLAIARDLRPASFD